jgi:hypothetical protein
METEALKQAIDALIAELGDETAIARPAAEHAVLEQIRLLLDRTREQHTGAARETWETYLPYAAKRCFQLTKLEEGWEDDLDYFASENAQFWLDNANASLEKGEIDRAKNALGQVLDTSRMLKRDMIARANVLLQALDIALEISDKKRSVQLFEEAEKVYRKHLAGGDQYTGSAWLQKIKKIGQQLAHHREQLRRYFQYAETVTVTIEADNEKDLERVIDYLQQNLVGKVKITRRTKEVNEADYSTERPRAGAYRARLKITLDSV